MVTSRKIKVGKRPVQALSMSLGAKNLVILAGRTGYIMCGYLNMKAANSFGDVAAKIVGVATIPDALAARIHSCSAAARKSGLYPGQPVRDALKIIA